MLSTSSKQGGREGGRAFLLSPSHTHIQKVKLTNQNLVVYHVTPAIKESELVYIQPSQIISFDMGKDDIAKYVHNRLQLLTHDKSR